MRRSYFLFLISLQGLAGLDPAHAATPAHYSPRSTWFETMLASVQAIDSQARERGFLPFESGIVRGGEPARKIRVEVSGAEFLHLFVAGDPDKVWGVANWAEPRLIDAQGKVHPLTRAVSEGPGKPAFDWSVRKGRHDININLHSGLYEPLRIAGREFPLGIHVQSDSEIVVPLEGNFERFEAWIGIDDWARGRGNVRFRALDRRAAAVERLWDLVARDFPHARPRREMRWEQQDRIWNVAWESWDLRALGRRYAEAASAVPRLQRRARELANSVADLEGLARVRALYLRACEVREARERLAAFDVESLRLAISDLTTTFGEGYPNGAGHLRELEELAASTRRILKRRNQANASQADPRTVLRTADRIDALRRKALLANPLLDFQRLLVVKRRPVGDPRRSQWADRGLGEYLGMPRQSSWGHGTMPNVDRWENEIAVLSPVADDGKLTALFRPPDNRLVTDIDLHWDGKRMLFAMPDDTKNWQVWELSADGGGLRQLTPEDVPDVHNYDPCYLPNGRVVFISTAPLQGVPCNAGVIVGMMYLMEGDGSGIRQVCFEQDHDYTPSVLNNGRVLYLRWDYTDTPHVWNRLLMSMNPDGTGQREFYGSNSYWPNSTFFARAVPGHPTRVAGIVTGHHEGRVGELVVFDPAKGRREADGVIQRIPGRGQRVEPVIEDKPTEHSWPKFLHPWPLSEKYFLVAAKPEPDSLWGVYLVDVFDNMVLLREEEEYALLEPIPFRSRPRPPVIPDQVEPGAQDAVVYLQDVYQGPGLEGVPRGEVKQLRVFGYHFGFQKMAGIDHRVGTDGPWEVKRVLGTVPVERDGSAMFRVPAKTPVSVQPLDTEGKALALMRSWMTAQPGEFLSCAGCHESHDRTPASTNTLALAKPPRALRPWHGPTRGFSFAREVQPVLDRYCVGCHHGGTRDGETADPDLRADQGGFIVYRRGEPELQSAEAAAKSELVGQHAGVFEPSYVALRKYVRVGGLESDLHALPPLEFHADASELIQMLRKGHHNVTLDREAWDRLITWIDLNAPCQGSWAEVSRIPISGQPARRVELRRLYGGVAEDCETLPPLPVRDVEPILPAPRATVRIDPPECIGWPFDAAEARRRQGASANATRTIGLGDGLTLEFVRIPAGRFVMGDAAGEGDERPLRVVEVERPFWMSKYEVTNEQFARFDPAHDSRFEHRSSWIFDEAYLGWPLNRPRQPVVRVSWNRAKAFCEWLGEETKLAVDLPTEAQWEYACRAGADTPLYYGSLDEDFSEFGNMADHSIRLLADQGWRPKAPDLAPRDDRYDDGSLVTAQVGSYLPNAWGLHDMHGNAAEWTRSPYRPFMDEGAEIAGTVDGRQRMVVRGGSWRDRPKRCRSGSRLSYLSYQRVFNVGFRVVLEERSSAELASRVGDQGRPVNGR